ncbi:hypothetical protein HGM15179_019455 [Zosterops borbonicus]|uniref:Uncharacterized protein n=1 Tax=Zosterops borbonicus TaxID=364589 RepID=A0A8K1DBL2_9PASS|nr:hypothetical protein HGM15179_019455 [Zosterops borbonicus]
MFGLWFFRPTLCPSSSSMFWKFINNCTHFVRGGIGDEAFQSFLSPFSFESVTSLLGNVQCPLNVKDTTFLIFQLNPAVVGKYLKEKCQDDSKDKRIIAINWALAYAYRTLLDTVGQQREAGGQGDKSEATAVTQTAAEPDSEPKSAAKPNNKPKTAAKPDSESKTLAVAPAKKHTQKSDQPVDDDASEVPSMPPDNTRSEAQPTPSQKLNKLTQNQEPNQLAQDQMPNQLAQDQESLLSPFPRRTFEA